jgi:hypothetical protein
VSRTYIVFGSDDKRNWKDLGPFTAGGAPQAIKQAIEKTQHGHYFAVAEGNITAVTPEVQQRAPIVRLRPMARGQLTVEDALKES